MEWKVGQASSAEKGKDWLLQVPQPSRFQHHQFRVEGGVVAFAVLAAQVGGQQMVGDFAEIAGQVLMRLFRSDNCVKNHFYSKLRKAIRRLNKLIHDVFPTQHKFIRESVLSRIIKTT